ncbi:sugar transferase [Pedobacter soli]|uniref:Sugar transferase involved in LPS biosynthesis (Colanic, teichoic acid) n=1 Tax=Pedobacter soli TaxID=390242 RepID=A0A1G6RW11_9SPHI|nr:sugar transferase [Pedobacter soli]SDD08621.1 Sugar transferase involved in LPS biosynthesis (colanic, teichoic acid) [Pedobacter soli]
MENAVKPDQMNNPIIALVGFEKDFQHIDFDACNFGNLHIVHFENGLRLVQEWTEQQLNVAAVISNSEILSNGGLSLLETLKKRQMPSTPFFLVVRYFNANLRILALTAGVSDVFRLPVEKERLEKRLNFLVQHWTSLNREVKIISRPVYRIGFAKRLFDVFFAGLALILLFPVFLIVAISIWVESKGPVFYYSLRSGTGFKVFRFYKFRSMYVNADQKVKDLKHLNQYDLDQEKKEVRKPELQLCNSCVALGKCQYPVYADGAQWCEKDDLYINSQKSGSAFFKIANDPRVTRVGHFIRNTSIDELPQLWNVIKGDMSIVGNRPLPIYEAEKLTTDKYVLRFAAPAGITGLWQVEKRGRGEMSEEERLVLDNTYALKQSFWNDIRLILKTIPALFQKENV